MLRRAASSRPLQHVVTFRTRTLPSACQLGLINQRRYLADKPTGPTPVILPGSDSKIKDAPPVPTLKTPITPSLTPKPAPADAKVPLTPDPVPAPPPTPRPLETAIPPTTPPPPPPKKKTHKFRNFVVITTLLTILGYAGGTYYALENDNFHDFFTEYVPFGEQIVLEIQDRLFRSRFANATPGSIPKPQYTSVTIPKRSGATWRVSEKEKEKEDPTKAQLDRDGPHLNAKKDEKKNPAAPTGSKAGETKKEEAKKEDTTTIPAAAAAAATILSKKDVPDGKSAKEHLGESKKDAGKTTSLGKDAIPHAPVEHHDPIMHDLVKIINSVISVINESSAKDHFEDAMHKTKSEVQAVNSKIQELKNKNVEVVKDALKEQEKEFTAVASGVVQTVEQQIQAVENRFRMEFEEERQRLVDTYRSKLDNELRKTDELAEERLKNALLAQALVLEEKWYAEIEDHVEHEREGRLGKIKELKEEVDKLGELTKQWVETVKENVKTQKMHIALDAVLTSVNDPEQPRPFVRELAALKEVSEDDEVVKAAIASINPAAYQKGVASPAQIIDRFRRVSTEVRKASLVPEDAGVFGHASSWVASKLLFQKKGLVEGGDDVESILARTETYLVEGELEKAAREMNQLKGWPKKLAGDWLREVRVLLEVRQAMDVISTQTRLLSLRRQ